MPAGSTRNPLTIFKKEISRVKTKIAPLVPVVDDAAKQIVAESAFLVAFTSYEEFLRRIIRSRLNDSRNLSNLKKASGVGILLAGFLQHIKTGREKQLNDFARLLLEDFFLKKSKAAELKKEATSKKISFWPKCNRPIEMIDKLRELRNDIAHGNKKCLILKENELETAIIFLEFCVEFVENNYRV
ncbi:MAG: HEPN domain-containing protein [Patescibacteria group bacterium]